MSPNPASRRTKHLEMRASAEGAGSGVKGGGERVKLTIEIQPKEAAALLREITKAPQTQAVKMDWSPIKEGVDVDVDAIKTELADGHAHDLICEYLHKLYGSGYVRSSEGGNCNIL